MFADLQQDWVLIFARSFESIPQQGIEILGT
jgi:hypothetical protein